MTVSEVKAFLAIGEKEGLESRVAHVSGIFCCRNTSVNDCSGSSWERLLLGFEKLAWPS